MPDQPLQRVMCPACGVGYRWRAEHVGGTVACKQCGNDFIVPDQPGPGLMIEPAGDDGIFELADTEDEQPSSTAGGQAAGPGRAGHAGKCPSCNSALKAHAVLCMNCGFNLREGKKMSGPQISALPPEERKAMRKDLSGMKWVRGGLWLNMAAVLLMFAMIPLPIAAGIAGLDYLLVISVLAYLSLLCNTAGSLLCLTAPKESGGRPILIPSVLLSLISSGMLLMSDFGALDDEYWWIADLLTFGATALFLLFFVKLAEYLEYDEIIERARKVLGLYVTIELGAYILYLPLICINCFIAIALLAMGIYTLFLYIALLIDLNNALTYRIGEQSD